jgi:hypothetical protein
MPVCCSLEHCLLPALCDELYSMLYWSVTDLPEMTALFFAAAAVAAVQASCG